MNDDVAAVVVTHFLGFPAQLGPISALAMQYGAMLIQDACETMDLGCGDKPVYAYGDVITHSFYHPHHLSTFGGGVVATHSKELHDQLQLIMHWGRECRCHYDAASCSAPHGLNHNFWYVRQGVNLELSELNACFARWQLRTWPQQESLRWEHWRTWSDALAGLPGIQTWRADQHISRSSFPSASKPPPLHRCHRSHSGRGRRSPEPHGRSNPSPSGLWPPWSRPAQELRTSPAAAVSSSASTRRSLASRSPTRQRSSAGCSASLDPVPFRVVAIRGGPPPRFHHPVPRSPRILHPKLPAFARSARSGLAQRRARGTALPPRPVLRGQVLLLQLRGGKPGRANPRRLCRRPASRTCRPYQLADRTKVRGIDIGGGTPTRLQANHWNDFARPSRRTQKPPATPSR